MNIAIGINHAIVAQAGGDTQPTAYQELGIGEYTVELTIEDAWDPDEQYRTATAAMLHHAHPDSAVFWVSCPDDMLRTLLMRHYGVPEEKTEAPVNWGLPKDSSASPSDTQGD